MRFKIMTLKSFRATTAARNGRRELLELISNTAFASALFGL